VLPVVEPLEGTDKEVRRLRREVLELHEENAKLLHTVNKIEHREASTPADRPPPMGHTHISTHEKAYEQSVQHESPRAETSHPTENKRKGTHFGQSNFAQQRASQYDPHSHYGTGYC
jgi:hypothetical protein